MRTLPSVVLLACLMLWNEAGAAGTEPTTMLSDRVYHERDFWLGDWRVVTAETHSLAGHAHIEKLLRGAAITMVWADADGSEIREWFYYDPPSRRWRQLYISDSGIVKTREAVQDQARGSIRFLGEITKLGGGKYLDRSTVSLLPDTRVHQVLERSKDEGRTWETYFEGLYERWDGPVQSKAR